MNHFKIRLENDLEWTDVYHCGDYPVNNIISDFLNAHPDWYAKTVIEIGSHGLYVEVLNVETNEKSTYYIEITMNFEIFKKS